MATYKIRGTSHNVIYPYFDESGGYKQQWESYDTELEAIQRKAFVDYLQKKKDREGMLKAVLDYKSKKTIEKIEKESKDVGSVFVSGEDNTGKTYRDLAQKWLPFYARKNRFKPTSYDSYNRNLANHILPYFGDWIASSISAEAVDAFVDYLSKKPCKGSKSHSKKASEIPALGSSSVVKCYNILMCSLETGKKWGYINEVPATAAPKEKWKKRNAWQPTQVYDAYVGIEEDQVLHLAVHIAFICSLRAGEVAGISVDKIDFYDRSMIIDRQLQRVSDESLAVLPANEVIHVFPKEVERSGSSLILQLPKTEKSVRKQYLTTPLLKEIKERLTQIDENKRIHGGEYHDYGLLICKPNGNPFDPKSFNRSFRQWQQANGIEDQIVFQGLRKSGQMHKIRESNYNYQLVADNAGHSPEVLLKHYDEARETEKRQLSSMVEIRFYGQEFKPEPVEAHPTDLTALMDAIKNNPDFSRQIVQVLLAGAVSV